jgi:hypothetical protein
MRYVMLIMDTDARRGWSEGQRQEAYERMIRFQEGLEARGLCKAADALRPPAEAVRIQVRGGKRLMVDGPFAEAKEVVSGFFLLECRSRDEALAIASECPAVEWTTVEVRETGKCIEA